VSRLVPHYVKRRAAAPAGSIPEALDQFAAEVRFYREIAPVLTSTGIRVPACYRAEDSGDGTLLELEDLSAWRPGADPAAAAAALGGMHRRWAGEAPARWPWLRPVGAAIDLVERLYTQTWPRLAARGDLPAGLAEFGARMVGRVTAAEYGIAAAGPLTLVHGDAQARNMRTGPDGEVALLDWEDVSAAPGALDLGWLLTASTDPARWDEVIAAYGGPGGSPGRAGVMADPLARVLPAVMVQGLFSMADEPAGSPEALAWTGRLAEALRRVR
jgi:hypothetical protein